MKKTLFFIVSQLIAFSSYAQVSPSSSLLLKSRRQNATSLDSSRYTVKPSQEKKTEEVVPLPEKEAEPSLPAAVKYEEDPLKEPVPKSLLQQAEGLPVVTKQPVDEDSIEEKELTGQVRDLVLGGDIEDIEKYKSLLHNNDLRRNMIELSLYPMYYYNNSASTYWMRDYYTNGSGIGLDGSIWLTPFFGFSASYAIGLQSDLRANPSGSERKSFDQSWFQAGLRIRNYFGLSRKAKRLSFGVDFYEYKLDMPKDADQRVSLKTSGLRLELNAMLPITTTRAWVLGVEIMPSLSHEEIDTAEQAKSGTDSSTNAVGLWIGNNYLLDRKNQVYWKLSHRIEKNSFDGQATEADAISGTQPTGVTVNNGTTMFSLGFTWGH